MIRIIRILSWLFVVVAFSAVPVIACAQDYTITEGTSISLVATSNLGAPNPYGFACGRNFGQTCYGGTLAPNGNINWTVNSSPVNSTYDQVDNDTYDCAVDDADHAMTCTNSYDESGYTAVLPAGSYTIVASIPASQDQYAAFSRTWTVLVNPAPVKQTPSMSVSCSPNPITFGSQNTTCVSSQSGGTGTLLWSINGNAWTTSGVNASVMGLSGWAPASYTIAVTYSGDNNYNSATASTVLTVNPASNPAPPPQGTIYQFIAKDNSGNSGYAPNGNIVAYTDSATGSWGVVYDPLNRIHTATASAGPYNSATVTWQYDSFGNRLSQSHTGSPSANIDDTWAHYDLPSTTPHNRMTSSQSSVLEGSMTYDGNGNLTYDGRRRYSYDVENRLCGVYDPTLGGNITQYLYNAEGQRVAKGHPATPPSDPTQPYCTNGSNFTVEEKYVLGLAGEQITQLDGSNNWQHTNIWAGSQLLATYDQESNSQQPLHFNVTDPLGTKRIQTTSAGVPELTCLSLPFGDGPDCTGSAQEATKHRFTGKERDSESGLDYFGARYYGSTMGRWMSPDWADKPEAVPYSSLDNPQSLNLYGYVGNNPLHKADPDGHEECCDVQTIDGLRQISGGIPIAPVAGAIAGVIAGMEIWNNREAIGNAVGDFLANSPGGGARGPGQLPANYYDAMSDGGKAPPNPNGQKGAPDHQAAVQEEADKARAAAGPGETVTQGTKIQVAGSNRRPDVQTVGANGKTKSIVEVERRPNSSRNKAREAEYDRLGVQHTTRPLPSNDKQQSSR